MYNHERLNFYKTYNMEIIKSLLDFVMHIDEHLMVMISDYGTLIYAILFLIVFVETGLIVMPFLPGDSLLFAAGALAAANNNEGLNIAVLIPLLIVAALCGDNVNYFVGKFLSDQIRKRERNFVFQTRIHYTHRSVL